MEQKIEWVDRKSLSSQKYVLFNGVRSLGEIRQFFSTCDELLNMCCTSANRMHSDIVTISEAGSDEKKFLLKNRQHGTESTLNDPSSSEKVFIFSLLFQIPVRLLNSCDGMLFMNCRIRLYILLKFRTVNTIYMLKEFPPHIKSTTSRVSRETNSYEFMIRILFRTSTDKY